MKITADFSTLVFPNCKTARATYIAILLVSYDYAPTGSIPLVTIYSYSYYKSFVMPWEREFGPIAIVIIIVIAVYTDADLVRVFSYY